ncbi:MAG TPA: hypothetical protein VJX67_17250, partial [Blastocatellia bacterium]|nr:hypothetical protein [Blastocatellia bacterium]
VTSGIVKRWYVRQWTTVAGESATAPVRPAAVDAGKDTVIASLNPEGPESQGPSYQDKGILRFWRARSTVESVGKYVEHATSTVFPALRAIEGHRGAYLLRRVAGGTVELAVLTLWESMEAVRKFAGMDPTKAVVEPEAQAVLTSFDDYVTHYDVVHSPEDTRE